MPDPQLRAADSDREAVATTLGRAMSEGRLAVDEYEQRLGQAYAARTYGELTALTADLPGPDATRPSPVAGPVPRPQACGSGPWMRWGWRAAWLPWATTALIVTMIWLASGVSGGHFDGFWPIWVIGPWGAVLLRRTLVGAPHRPRDRGHRHF